MMIARRGDNDANLAVERDHARAMALAAVVSRGICPDLITHFQKAEKHRQAGNHARAQIHLAFARLPRLGEADAFRLFLADEFLRQGFTPSLLLKELGFSDKDVALLKFPGQQHIPAGTDRRRFKRWRRQLRGWAERSAWRKRPG